MLRGNPPYLNARSFPLAAVAALATSIVAGAIVASISPSGAGAPSTAAIMALQTKGDLNAAMTLAGQTHGEERGPGAADEEKSENRAYPATSVPLAASAKARQTFAQIQQKGHNNNASGGNWQLLGPSEAREPGILTFSGADAVTSGRVTSLAVAPSCASAQCTLYAAAAGGGIWRTDNALATTPSWRFISGSLQTNAIGTIVIDPTDSTGNTLYVGTGEPNASGDSEAGVGVYRSTNGGTTWALLAGSTFANGRSVSSIVIDPTNANVVYVATTRGVRGVSSVTGGSTSNPPGASPFGLYKSTNGGTSFNFIWDGAGTVRGVNHVELDPTDSQTIYASAFQVGIWRSSVRLDGTPAFKKVFATAEPGNNASRAEFALTTKAGHTRIYAGDGTSGLAGLESTFWRLDNADAAASTLVNSTPANVGGWKKLSSPVNGEPGYATFNYCTQQCWYDNVVATPAGFPDVVFVAGSFLYGELGLRSNGRAVLRSTTAGEPDATKSDRTFTDMTNDGTSSSTPNGIHPDQHAMAFVPGNPNIWFNGSDGGVVRSSGAYTDVTSQCSGRPIGAASMRTCKRLLSAVPTRLYSLNKGLSTLQFQSLSFNPQNPTGEVMGGTQDNGTWLFKGNTQVWNQSIWGDGGQSGFNVTNPTIRFNTFFSEYTDANFQGGDPTKWVVISAPLLSSPEGSAFYMPIIADPTVGGTMFVGLERVWRTKDNGGDQTYLEAHCPEFTTAGDKAGCGDWVPLGTINLAESAGARGGPGGGRYIVAVERAPSDAHTLWTAARGGAVYISKNADAATASGVTFKRLDTLAANSPGRFVSSIYIDPTDANHAWISYGGYNYNTAAQPGHVFEVRYNQAAGTATWTDLHVENGPDGELPITDLVRDDRTGELFAATDFGVLVRDPHSGGWTTLGDGLPRVEVSGLTISVGTRTLYAATHGRGAWKLPLQSQGGQGGNGN